MLFRLKVLAVRGLLVVSGLQLAHSVGSVGQQFVPPTQEEDNRVLILKTFLEEQQSPASHLASEFLKAADRHNLDWRLLPSLAVVESGAGRTCENNNIFGWDSGRAAFATIEEGIHYVASRLANSNLYRDKQLDEILLTYNPYPDYPARVKSVMTRLGPHPVLPASWFAD